MPAIATLLMTAIISDTGGFVYLQHLGPHLPHRCLPDGQEVNLRQITYQLFDLTSQERMRLMGRLFTDARFSHQTAAWRWPWSTRNCSRSMARPTMILKASSPTCATSLGSRSLFWFAEMKRRHPAGQYPQQRPFQRG